MAPMIQCCASQDIDTHFFFSILSGQEHQTAQVSFIVSMWPRSQKSAQHGPRILGFYVYVSLQQVYDPISKNLLWKLPHGSHPCIPILQAPSALSIGAFWSVFRSCCVCLRFLDISFSFQRCIRLNTHFLWTRGRR